ncbi:MAG: polysaccharide biosynthesis C-terminal domain-containing protein [Rhodopila sp.]
MWTLIDPMMLPAASTLLLGTDYAIVKQLRVENLALRLVIGSLLISTLPASAFCLLAIGLAANLIFHLAWADALLLTLAGEAIILITQTAFRGSGAVYSFAALLLSRNVLYLVVLVIARALSPLSLDRTFFLRGGCVILVSLIAVAAIRPIPLINWARYRDALHYGFPLLLTTFTYSLSDMADRWFLAEFDGVIAVGVYALHLKLAAILSQAIVIPFGLWFSPERFRHLNDYDGGRIFFIRTAVALAVICGFLSGGVWLSRDFTLSLIAPGIVASPLTLACSFGAVICLGLSQALNIGLLLPGHTSKNVINTVSAVVATVVASAILVPFFGMNGAAISRLFGGLVLLAATAAWSHRVFPVAFPFAVMLVYFVASVAIAIGIDRVTTGHNLPGIVIALVAWTSFTFLSGAILKRQLRSSGHSPITISLTPFIEENEHDE